ncbi:MAG TPA: tetratricopeptide repeat protein [Casimicrobiaceae bacterium]|nr:tetratricopeptide repeat protein [Casimicrobiaceae bacterium]
MKEYAAGIQSSELRLVDAAAEKKRAPDAHAAGAAHDAADNGTREPRNGSVDARVATAPYNLAGPAAAASPGASGSGESGSPAIDKFFIAATKEFEAGIVDQPLWKHAVAQSAGDRTLATNSYLRARATALRVAKRDKRQERLDRRARALNELGHPAGPVGPSGEAPQQRAPSPSAGMAALKRGRMIWTGGALAAAFVVALILVLRWGGEANQHKAMLASSGSPAGASATKAAKPAAVAAAAATGSRDDAQRMDWAGKLEQLGTDGNWNVVVLHAGEWVRAQPENASAWKALAAGYVKLRQYREALEAANKLVQLAPEDAAAWRSLGEVNATLRRPAEALAAFEQAVARDDRDTASMVQVGALAVQLGRYADARAAFSRALALDPTDVDAMCGAASLAQKEQRAKEAEALLRQVAVLEARCRDTEGESVRVAIGGKASPAVSPR